MLPSAVPMALPFTMSMNLPENVLPPDAPESFIALRTAPGNLLMSGSTVM